MCITQETHLDGITALVPLFQVLGQPFVMLSIYKRILKLHQCWVSKFHHADLQNSFSLFQKLLRKWMTWLLITDQNQKLLNWNLISHDPFLSGSRANTSDIPSFLTQNLTLVTREVGKSDRKISESYILLLKTPPLFSLTGREVYGRQKKNCKSSATSCCL